MRVRNIFRFKSIITVILFAVIISSCKEEKKKEVETPEVEEVVSNKEPYFKLSLAQWSIHNMIIKDKVDPYTFAEKAKNWGFSGLEYVSQLYPADLENNEYSPEAMAAFVEKSNAEAKKHGLQNVLIMIDGQGNLAVSDAAERKAAVERHHKWVDAAAAMGCGAIRVNLNGESDPVKWHANAVDGLIKLATYAKDKGINILVENHGGLSSNGALHAAVMKEVNMDNCGTLPDFGNFCITRKKGSWDCEEMYDIYKGVTELMPYAKAVSAKSNVFDADGNEVNIDYKKMLQIVKDAGYTGYIGVEYEGKDLSEEDGIIATRDLMLKLANELN